MLRAFRLGVALAAALAFAAPALAQAPTSNPTVVQVGPGLTNALGVQNGTPVAPGQTLSPQVWTFPYAVDHTVLASEMGGLLIHTSSSAHAFTLPAANTAGFQQGQTVCIENDGTGTLSIASASAIIGLISLTQNGLACAVSDGAAANTWHVSGGAGAVALLTGLGTEFTTSGNTLHIASGGVSLAMQANVAGGTLLGNPTTSSAAPAASVTPVLGIPGTSSGTLGLAGVTAGTTTFKTADNTTNHTLTFPATVCPSGQTFSDNGSGVLSCASAGAGTVTSVTPGPGVTSSSTGVAGTTTPITGSGTFSVDAGWLANYFGGLSVSNDGSLPNTTVDTAAGAAASDDNTVLMKLGVFTKTTGAWSLGSAGGCLDTGAVANSTWYHLFVIERTDTQVVDEVCSTSVSPTMPTSYTKKRRIGSFKTDGSGNILAFSMVGNAVYWATATLDVNAASIGTTAALQTLNVPPGVKVEPLCRWSVSNATGAGFLLTSPDETDVAPSTGLAFSSAPGFDKDVFGTGAGESNGNCPSLTTNTNQQVRARASAASTSLSIASRGWKEPQHGAASSIVTANFQAFTASGTWTKPSNVTMVYVEAVGAGGPGGGGPRQATSTACSGGGGGGGGVIKRGWFPASALGLTETVTVGPQATGGAAATGDTLAGGTGTRSADSSFGTWLIAYSGGVGAGGGLATGAGSGGGAGIAGPGGNASGSSNGSAGLLSTFGGSSWVDGGTPGGAGASGAAGGGSANPSGYGATGAGAGAGISGANAVFSGGQGAANAVTLGLVTSGATAGNPGTGGTSLGASIFLQGGSGASGAGSSTSVGESGADGGIPGGGGSGAACTQNGHAGGVGGKGARGEVRVWAF